MKLALRTHRVRWIVPIELALAIIGSLYGEVSLLVPSFSGMGAVPVTVIAALAGTTSLALPINAAWPSSRTVPVRSDSLICLAVLATALAPAVATCVVLGSLHPERAALEYLSVFGWLLALQMAAATLLSGTYQAMAPVTYVLLCALLGRVDSSIQPWAWPLAEIPVGIALVVGTSALVAALALFAFLGLHRSHG